MVHPFRFGLEITQAVNDRARQAELCQTCRVFRRTWRVRRVSAHTSHMCRRQIVELHTENP